MFHYTHSDPLTGQSLTLNSDLLVTTLAQINGGTIAGNSGLIIGDHVQVGPPQYVGVLNWNGGTIGSTEGWNQPTLPLLTIGVDSQANIGGAAAKTLDGRLLENYGTVTWTGGDIVLKDQAKIDDAGVMNIELGADATISGNSEALTKFTVATGGTLNINPQQVGPYGNPMVTSTLVNNGVVNIDSGNLFAQYNTITTGQYTIAPGSELDFNLANTITLDGSTGTCVFTGGGETYFGSGSHVIIIGTVNVRNVDDNSALLDDTANSTLIINGTYIWRGAGKWAGSGVTQIGANHSGGTLNLAAADTTAFDLQRQVVNYGTITWTKAADIHVTNGGSITNNLGSTFDIGAAKRITGTGRFTAGGLLLKSVGGAAEINTPFSQPAGGKMKGKLGSLIITNRVALLGDADVDAGATLAFDGGLEQDGGTMTDNGTITVAGNYVQTAGIFNAASGASLYVSGAFDEQGGVLNLLGGSLEADGGYTVEYGASLVGNGQITANVTNSGTIQVGGSGAVGGLTLLAQSAAGVSGAFTQTSIGALNMEIASASSYDSLSAAGTVALGGTLNVQTLNGFTPTAGQWFNLLPTLSSGHFAVLNLPTFLGVVLVPEYNAVGHPGFSLLAELPTYATLTSSSGYYNPTSAPGQSVTFTATVSATAGSAPTGTVSFWDGQTLLGTATLSGGMMGSQATFTTNTLSLGSHTITAVYNGDATFAGSRSSSLTQTVQQQVAWIMLMSSSDPSNYGQAVTFTAMVSGSGGTPTGTVSFYDGTTLLGTVTLSCGMMGAQATFTISTLSIGAHTITARYSGDAAWASGDSFPLTQYVQ